ncbi:septum formation initiator family protein [Tropicimonas sp. IMCC6043]|uniref:FtsB family cell division protein n=1 Tax=Tropicimonas sp. IMCC6043 TaxID=2510645 RepID=UPI00101BF4AB|nr:septum formation initiator family protein [Tropicimonas sp. IMCC6043]RYH11166.1 septum formation initiator family protein [Tropicimonas sp. IMCC6043]
MSSSASRPAVKTAAFVTIFLLLAMYFTFAAMQGDFGLFRRIEIEAETRALEAEKAKLEAEVARLSNKTRRLSEDYLDLDLLDEQARTVLGLIRVDEIVIR